MEDNNLQEREGSLRGFEPSGRELVNPDKRFTADEPDVPSFLKKVSDIEMRRWAFYWLIPTFAFSIILTYTAIFLHGCNECQFKLPSEFLHWLGAATVGEIGGLLIIAFRYLFPVQE
jgi:hypothetical protein